MVAAERKFPTLCTSTNACMFHAQVDYMYGKCGWTSCLMEMNVEDGAMLMLIQRNFYWCCKNYQRERALLM